MVKNKQNPKDDVSIFFDVAKTSTPKIHPNLKARILRDANKICGGGDVVRDRTRLDSTLDLLNELAGFPSVVGLTSSLAVGVCIGFYSPDWSESLAIFFQIDTFDAVDFTGSFFGMNEIF